MLNLLASGVANEALRGEVVLLGPKVLEESLFIYSDPSRASTTRIDSAYLNLVRFPYEEALLTPLESAKAVQLAQDVDDGEAEALAIAVERSISILSDDSAAIRLAPSLNVTVRTSLDVLYNWGLTHPADRIRDALKAMRVLANYAPPRRHKYRAWYLEMLN